jgi:hypothetical protein
MLRLDACRGGHGFGGVQQTPEGPTRGFQEQQEGRDETRQRVTPNGRCAHD